jgi:hypothetical protein
MNSQKAPKEFCHMDVETDGIAMNALAEVYNDGWELFAPPAWDANSRVWRVLLCRDKAVAPVIAPEPTTKPTLISEAIPITPPATITEQPIVPPAPAPEPTTDQPEAESVDEAHAEDTTPPKGDEQHVIIVMPTLYPAMDFDAEMRRIRADKTLSPMEKTEAIKTAGNEIALAKARVAGEQAWDAWNRLYPVTKPSFLLPAEGEA